MIFNSAVFIIVSVITFLAALSHASVAVVDAYLETYDYFYQRWWAN